MRVLHSAKRACVIFHGARTCEIILAVHLLRLLQAQRVLHDSASLADCCMFMAFIDLDTWFNEHALNKINITQNVLRIVDRASQCSE